MTRLYVFVAAVLLFSGFQSGCSCHGVAPIGPEYCDTEADCQDGQACADNACTTPDDGTGGDGGGTGGDPDGGATGDTDSGTGDPSDGGTGDTDSGTGGDPDGGTSDGGTGGDPDGGSTGGDGGTTDGGTGGCTLDTECPGQICNAGVCADPGPSGGTCEDTSDCQTGLVCVNSVCQQPPTGCVVDGDCDTGEVCFLGQCLLNTDDGDPETCIPGEVYICHVPPGDPTAAHTLCVGYKAANPHLTHGDALNQCL